LQRKINLTTDLTPPLVSAVVPTRNRPDLVCRAVRSALNQTYPNFEVVVVVDGPDPATVAALEELRNPCVRIIALSENVGGSEARNIGAREARGEWVALLDDDDEWLPEKTSLQMALLRKSPYRFPIGACRMIGRRKDGDSIIPSRTPRMGEPLSEYLLCRKTPVWGEGVIQTSMLVVRKALLEQVPFATGLSRHQDWDWLLRAFCNDGVGCEWVLQPMVIFHMNSSEERLSRDGRWQPSLTWASNNPLITKRAFIHFVALIITPKFSLRRDLSHLPKLLRAAKEYGMADTRAIIFGLLHLLISERFLRVAARMARVTPSRPSRRLPVLQADSSGL
jgi:glycosyltransferase involved in cell wall biosynthesis